MVFRNSGRAFGVSWRRRLGLGLAALLFAQVAAQPLLPLAFAQVPFVPPPATRISDAPAKDETTELQRILEPLPKIDAPDSIRPTSTDGLGTGLATGVGVNIGTTFGLATLDALKQGKAPDQALAAGAGEVTKPRYLLGTIGGSVGGGLAGLALGSALSAAIPGVGPLLGAIITAVPAAVGASYGASMGRNTIDNLQGGGRTALVRAFNRIDHATLLGQSIGSGIGFAVGSALIPIPFLGGFIGAFVGGMAGGWIASALRDRFAPNWRPHADSDVPRYATPSTGASASAPTVRESIATQAGASSPDGRTLDLEERRRAAYARYMDAVGKNPTSPEAATALEAFRALDARTRGGDARRP